MKEYFIKNCFLDFGLLSPDRPLSNGGLVIAFHLSVRWSVGHISQQDNFNVNLVWPREFKITQNIYLDKTTDL